MSNYFHTHLVLFFLIKDTLIHLRALFFHWGMFFRTAKSAETLQNFFSLFWVLPKDCDPTFIHDDSGFGVVFSFIIESGLDIVVRGI